jgi:SNF2 family DNA or RNA helicase
MRARLEGDLVVVEAAGIELLRAKSAVAAAVGIGAVKMRPGVGFTLPVGFAANAREILVTYNPDQALQDRLEALGRHAAARQTALAIAENGYTGVLEGNWPSILDPHQVNAVAAMTVPGLAGLCLFDEQGSGKTVMAVAAFDVLKARDLIDRLIILCPKTMIEEWRKDFTRFLGEKYKIVALTDPVHPVYPQGFEDFDVYLTNYEGLGKVGARLAATSAQARTLLAVDESFFLKNPDARRTALARDLRSSCAMGYVLCGTPAPNSFADVISQFDLADNGFTFGNVRPDSPAEVQLRIDSRGTMVRRLKREIMPELADKTIIPVRVDLSPRQRALYDRAKNDLELRLRTMDNRTVIRRTDSYFQERAALLLICSSPASVDPTFHDDPAKMVELDALLDSLIEGQGKKVVLWSYYRDTTELFAVRYERFNPVSITGATPADKRRAAVDAFQNDPAVKLFIGNPGAAGAGITLTAASDAVYYSLSSRAADFLQSLDRIHRRGQTAPEVNIYVLLAAGTIEEHEFSRLLHKEADQHALLKDDDDTHFTVADALAELGPPDGQ